MVSLVLSTTTQQNKKETMSITNVNPEATNQQIINFVETLMTFSTNSLTSINKVTKEEVYNNG